MPKVDFANIDWGKVDWTNLVLYDIILHGAVLAFIVVTVQQVTKLLQSLFVTGKANEWVLIMNNGKLKATGIGLATFKGPYDQVAKFPARIFKASFSTEQVTLEMQGVKVSGILVWSINRVGEGPFNAYKNLGPDLSSDNPAHANDTLVSMSSAIVRNCIANSTIEQMLRERQKVCQAIKKEMFDVVKGWGVWLETVEITDVVISSGSLFKDMQADFREKMKKESELYKMVIQSEIDEIKAKDDLAMQKKRRDAEIERQIYAKRIDEEIAEESDKQLAQLTVIANEKAKMVQEFEKWKRNVEAESNQAVLEIDKQKQVIENDAYIQTNNDNEETSKVQKENEKLEFQRDQVITDMTDKSRVKIEQAKIALVKAEMDEKLMALEAIDAAKKCYSRLRISEMRMSSYSAQDQGSEVLQSIVDKYHQAKRNTGN